MIPTLSNNSAPSLTNTKPMDNITKIIRDYLKNEGYLCEVYSGTINDTDSTSNHYVTILHKNGRIIIHAYSQDSIDIKPTEINLNDPNAFKILINNLKEL